MPLGGRIASLGVTNDDDEGLVRVTLQKRKGVAPYTPAIEPRASILPSIIPWRIKTRATKANPKTSDKEWVISFTRNKEDPTSSSFDGESTDDIPIMPLHKSAPTP